MLWRNSPRFSEKAAMNANAAADFQEQPDHPRHGRREGHLLCSPDGCIHDPDGVVGEKLDFILEMRAKDPMHCKPYADKYGVEFVPGEKCWGVKDVDVYCPLRCRTTSRRKVTHSCTR